jgi:cellulose synthase/poly-beta-1,6-N-acetylglucosamine synthase-like glycosyltransferase
MYKIFVELLKSFITIKTMQETTYNKQQPSEISKTKGVYIAVLNQGGIRPELSYLLTDLTHQNKYRLYLTYPAGKPISHNRNTIIKDFLAKPEYDYLMMLDGDIIPPLNVLDLVDYQKDIMGAVCFAYMDNSIVPLVLDSNPDKTGKPYIVKDVQGDEGLIEVDAIGSGLIIIKREVLEKVKAPFSNIYDEDGIKTMGLDLSFCNKAKKLGYKVWCHLDFVCSHWTTIDLKDVYQGLSVSNEIKRQKLNPTR